MHEEAKSLGLKVSCAKTKVPSSGGLLDDTVKYVPGFGEDTEVTQSFTYHSALSTNGFFFHFAVGSLNINIWYFFISMKPDKDSSFSHLYPYLKT